MAKNDSNSKRVLVRLPRSLIEVIDELIAEYPHVSGSRQQYIESAIRVYTRIIVESETHRIKLLETKRK